MKASAAACLLRVAAVLGSALAAACAPPPAPGFQGYVEGEFVSVASPLAGRLDRLAVARGDTVPADAPLYVLEAVSEQAAERQAQEQVKVAEAQLADLRQGRRVPEQDVVRAQLAQARADQTRLSTQLARDEAQFAIGGIARAQLDDTRAAHAAAQARVDQFANELRVAQQPSRAEQIRAQSAQVESARAALAQAAWRLGQKAVRSTQAGRVQDTLYREGEWVAAGAPVIRLLPPGNVKVRFFVPQPVAATLAVGTRATLRCDGCGADIGLDVTFVSTQAEFTPPVIYSNETRSKLVFMVEARPTLADAVRLHPGQPVAVVLR